jgi:hypothetical protein
MGVVGMLERFASDTMRISRILFEYPFQGDRVVMTDMIYNEHET